MKIVLACVLALLTLSACATTVPTVEEGWVPLAEWNYRVTHTNPVATVVEAFGRAATDSRSTTVRTYCYFSRRYTRCTSY